jgi:hypothetical protein
MSQRDNWIENVIKADSAVGKIQPSAELIDRLKAIPSTVKESYDLVPRKVVWAVAASVAILICVNLVSFKNYDSSAKENLSQTEVSESYFSYLEQI